jgi:hypothetical protein
MTGRRRRLTRAVMIALPLVALALMLLRVEIRFADPDEEEAQ